MVAIVTGKGAGLANGSGSLLGNAGQLGSASTGRAGEGVTVNAATGNLVLTDMDEMLIGRGPDAAISRTYNSLGAWDGDNDDYWRAGVYRRVTALTGTYAAAGSTVKRTDWDGSETTYTWNSTANAYVETDGPGAYDTLTRSGTTWTWTNGDSQTTETYDDSNSGRITATTDTSGNSLTYTYTSGLLTRVSTPATNEYVDLTYSGTLLTSLVTHSTVPVAQITRVFYSYDASSRLTKVQINLTPSDNSSSTGTNYEINYTYDGTSKRVATIAQSDGTLLTIGYTLVGSDYRVSSVTEAVGTGSDRTTSFSYDTTNRVTTITDALGQVTTLTYDTGNNLTKIVTPPVGGSAQAITQQFSYESDGDVASVTLGGGQTIAYSYDGNGNRILERDAAGNTIARTYSAKNELLTETHYLTPDPDGAGAGTPSSPLVTNYIYDAKSHLRYVVTPEGRVTEYRYDGFGQQISKIDYSSATYSSTMTEAALNGWVSGTVDRSTAQRTDTWYDFRGNVARTVTYATLDAYGEGTQDPAAIIGATGTSVVQQADGSYRVTKTAGSSGWNADAQSTVKADGDFTLVIKPNQNTQALMVGVSTTPTANAGFSAMNYGFYLDFGSVYSSESGTNTPFGLSYAAGDSLSITRVGTTLRYYQNGALLRTVTGATGTMYFDCSINSGGSMDVTFTPQPITVGANTAVSTTADGLTKIQKNVNTAAWDADARGSAPATGDFVLHLRLTQSNTAMAAGASTAPGTSSALGNIDYGLYFAASGTVYSTQAGTTTSLGISYVFGENYWMVRTGSTIAAYKGATLEQALAAGAITTFTGATGTMYFDSSIYDYGGTIVADFTPGATSTPEITRTDYVYDPSGRLLSRAIAGQRAETFVYDGLGRITSTLDMVGSTTTTSYSDNGTSATTTVTLANGLVQTSTYDRAGELITYAESGTGVTTATTTYSYDGLGRLRAVTDPTGQGHYYFYDAIGRKIADVDADGSVTEYRYDANSNLTSTTRYANKLSSAQLAALTNGSIAIGTATNASVAQQSSGLYRVTKTASGNSWNADAHSTGAIDGDFILQMIPNQSSKNSIVGVSSSPSTGGLSGVTLGIDFDANGTTYLYPPGNVSLNPAAYTFWAGGDMFWMQRVGSTVSFYKGATFASAVAAGAIRTTTGVTGSLYLSTILYESGNAVDVGFTPAPVTFDAIRPAADAANDRWNWNLYDLANRLVETVDGTGAVTQMTYDGASNLTSTTRHANKLSSAQLAALTNGSIAIGTATNASVAQQSSGLYRVTKTASGNSWNADAHSTGAIDGDFILQMIPNQSSKNSIVGVSSSPSTGGLSGVTLGIDFDANGTTYLYPPGNVSLNPAVYTFWASGDMFWMQRVGSTVSFYKGATFASAVAAGAIRTTTGVTGSLYLSTILYESGNAVDVGFAPSGPIIPAADATNDRISRVLYDNDGNVTGTLDAEGFLTETIYDGAGRKIRTVAYSDDVDPSVRATGSLSTLKSNLTADSTKDIRNQGLYDSRGLLRASVDGEGAVTRFDYTPAGYASKETTGQKVDPTTNWTLATLPAAGGSEILSIVTRAFNRYGQKVSETVTLTGSTTTTTSYTYDNMRRLVSTVTQSGGIDPRTYKQRYDLQGRLTSELSGNGNVALAALGGSPTQTQIDTIYAQYGWTYTYDSADRLTSKTGPAGTSGGAGAKSLYYYTADGSLAYQVDASGEVVEYRYDAFGERTETIVYGTRIASGTLSGMTGGLVTSGVTSTMTALASGTLDSSTHIDFNVDGSVKQSTDALSNVTSYSYNAFGELVSDVAPLDGSSTIETDRTYDRRGLLKTQTVDVGSGHKNIVTSYGYDAFGRAVTLTNALSKATTTTYDRKGRVATVKDALNNTTTYTYDARDNLVAVTDALGKVTRFVYDKANRKIATIDALGDLTATSYDADGRVVATRAYNNTISLTGLATEVAENNSTYTTALANTNAADQVTRLAYDKDGQLQFTVDALMHVVEHGYDATGNEIRTTAYDGTIGTDGTGVYSATFIAGQISSLGLASAAGTRVTRRVYDATNRLNYSIDAIGQVTWTVYDAKGQVAKQVEFAALYSTSGDPSVGTMDTWRTANATLTNDRTTRAYYDKKGQLSFSIDALGYVARVEYDKAGHVRKQTAYADAYSASDTTTLADLTAAFASPPSTKRVTEFTYDSAGRLETTIDPEGYVTRLVLDATGQITSSTEDYGGTDASVIAYTYDDVGRVTSVTRASGASEASTSYAFYDAVGNKSAAVDGDKYLTVWTYDANGNALTETHYATQIASAFTTATSVATLQGYAAGSTIASSAAYDAFGRTTSTTDARGSVVATSYDVLNCVASSTEQMESGTGDDRVTSYTYDSFGDVVKVHDPRGNDSFAYFDKLGRVFRQVDAEKFVTDTAYTRGGKVLTVKRYMTAATGTISETAMPGTPGGTVATTTFGYDKDDRLTSTTDAESKTETYILNAFGERTELRNKLYNGTTVTRVTSYTYDKRGLMLTETLPADTLNGSGAATAIINSYAYDHRGNLKTKVEAYGAPEARTTTYTYDKLDRVTKTESDQVSVVEDDLTVKTGVTPTTTVSYDHRGNVIETVSTGIASGWTDAHSMRTVSWYDGFGNKTDEVQLVDTVSSVNKGTLSHWTYDANGNALTAKVYGDLVTMPALATDVVPTPVDSSNYRLTSYAYDRANRVTTTTVAGLLIGEWTGSAYALTSSASAVTTLVYDAGGNVVDQQDARGNHVYTWYDKLGRAVAQIDAENYLTTWSRDAEGNVLTETRYANKVTGSFSTATAASALTGLLGTGAADSDRTTSFTYDLDGRRLTETRASVAYVSVDSGGTVTSGTASSVVTYTYNALGQVLSKVEANGDTTGYTYDVAGRLTLETGQSFTDYTGTTVTPRTGYVYDGLGNLKSTRVQVDASGTNAADRVTSYTYGASGRLATMTDAAGNTHSYAYDAEGRQVRDSYVRVMSDGTTSITEASVTRYDRLGRAVTQTNAHLESGTWVFTTGGSGTDYYAAVRTRYDAYGEVTGRGTTGGSTGPGGTPVYQETFDYDAGGRLWRSNTGDGVQRFHVYDKAGNETLTLASAGADLSSLTLSNYTASITSTGDTSTTDAVSTVSIYDKRGQVTATQEPDRLLATGASTVTITHAKTYNAFGEVLSETDARGYTTSYAYNSMGRMLSKVSPQVSITSEAGAASNVNPTEYYGYDLSGRLDRVTDANGNITKRALLAGTGHGQDDALVTKEFHADTGVFETRYDVFGDAVTLVDELGSAESRTYDKLDQLITVQRRGALLTDHYSYDVLGQRTAHWNSQFGSSAVERTDYDAMGRVVSSYNYAGDQTITTYAWDGSLQTNIAGTAVTIGGWTKTVSTIADRVSGSDWIFASVEKQDYFGHVDDRTDMGGYDYDFAYDRAGRLTSQTMKVASGVTVAIDAYTYFNTNQVATYSEGDPEATNTVSHRTVTAYSYDANGNLLSEKLSRRVGTLIIEHEHDPETHQTWDEIVGYYVDETVAREGRATYDALGRMVSYTDLDASAAADVEKLWFYDANSNVREMSARYRPLNSDGSYGAMPTSANQVYWYAYDSMNRVVVTQGIQSGSTIARGSTGTSLTYNAAGQRATITDAGGTETYGYRADGQLTSMLEGGVTRATYWRDALGRVTDYAEYDLTAALRGARSSIVYDLRDQVLNEYGKQKQGSNWVYTQTINDYDAAGLGTELTAALTTTSTGSSSGAMLYGSRTKYWSSSSGSYSPVPGYGSSDDTAYPDSDTQYRYYWADGAQLSSQVLHDKNGTSTVAYNYSNGGHILSVNNSATGTTLKSATYTTDGQGRILSREQNIPSGSTNAPSDLHFYFGGVRMGDVSDNGTANLDYAASIAARAAAPGTGVFRGGATSGTAYADFDQSYDAINGSDAEVAGRYTVSAGDTLTGIAQALWGDSALWYVLADANGLTASSTLVAGQSLTVPSTVHSIHNNADTFRPYNPNEAMGDTSPTAPKPAKKGCGVFGLIMMVAIAVAVSIVTAGAAVAATTSVGGIFGSGGGIAAVLGTAGAGTAAAGVGAGTLIAAGVVGGAVGSLASQGFGIAIGMQTSINWKGVAIAGIAGGIGAGIGQIGSGASQTANAVTKAALQAAKSPLMNALKAFASGAVRGIAGNALTQDIASITHLQKNVDFLGIALGGLGGGVGAAVGSFQTGQGALALIGRDLSSGMASGIATAGARSLITGTDFGDNLIAALPDIIGQTVGNAVGSELSAPSGAKGSRLAGKIGSSVSSPRPENQYRLPNGEWVSYIDSPDEYGGYGPSAPEQKNDAAACPDITIEFKPWSTTMEGLELRYRNYRIGVGKGKISQDVEIWGNFLGDKLQVNFVSSAFNFGPYIPPSRSMYFLTHPDEDPASLVYAFHQAAVRAALGHVDGPVFTNPSRPLLPRDAEENARLRALFQDSDDMGFGFAAIGYGLGGDETQIHGWNNLGNIVNSVGTGVEVGPRAAEPVPYRVTEYSRVESDVPVTAPEPPKEPSKERPSTRLSQPGGLMATEGDRVVRADGSLSEPTHPLFKHGPEVTDAYLKGRVQDEIIAKNRKGLRTAFNDRAQMEEAIAKTLSMRHGAISAWLATNPKAGYTKAFEADPGMGNLGRGFEVTTKGGPMVRITRSMPNVKVVLMPNGHGSYVIHTAHPF